MATLQKPKIKKKKSAKKAESVILTDNEANSSTSSLTNSIPSQDCFISKQLSEICLEEDDDEGGDQVIGVSTDECVIDDENTVEREPVDGDCDHIGSLSSVEFVDIVSEYSKIQKQEDVENAESEESKETQHEIVIPIRTEEPSAPQESTSSAAIYYPKLNTLDSLEAELSTPINIENTLTQLKCKPFTADQLKELYTNPEIAMSESFEDEFIRTELQSNYKDHILYDLLIKYSKSRYNLMINRNDLKNIKKSIPLDASQFWTIENRSSRYVGKCMDGTTVTGIEAYTYAVLNEPLVDKVQSLLTDSTNLISTCSFSMINSEIWRLEIEQKINELLTARPDFTSLSPNEPVRLNSNIKDDLLQPIRDIRVSISILFSFTRRSQPDKVFSNEIKNWLNKLVAVHLRVATWQDHLFLMYHVLRCPAGVASWTTNFIQLPSPVTESHRPIFNSEETHHCMAFIKTLLLPIKKRNEFLVQLKDDSKVLDGVKDDIWVLVDSDGDEDHTPTGDCIGLKENDLIAFLNQVPFEELFARMTFATKQNEKYSIAENSITGHHLLKFIAFGTNLVELLGEGLKTYDTERFKQFSKMLSRLVRHTVLYVSNVNGIFKNNINSKDSQLCLRIQIEYDTFVLRASHHIYKSRSLGAWQYLAILPFSDLCAQTIWKLYYALMVGFTEDIIENIDDDFKKKVLKSERLRAFNDTIFDVPSDDMYYLLQTFSSMALSRDSKDADFIVRVTMDLFHIGFLNQSTQELCYKISRDLLVNITTLHPYLISSILVELKENYETVDNAVYLFKSLPLNKWKPVEPFDFEYVASLILNYGFDTTKSLLARTIISRLNWGYDDSKKLFLSHDIHIRMGCLIAEVASKHVPEVVGSSGISESVRSVSNLVKGQTTRQQFTAWCWNMISLLRLHRMDQSSAEIIQTLHNPSDAMRYIPELERIQAIYQGVSDSRPIALYLSILCSEWGHSVPQICHKGFIQMQLLLSDYRHSTVIRCIQLIVPLFLECPESLCNCDKFQSILSQLLAADKTYIKMAKDLITTDTGPVVELFGNMIQSQITNYVSYGLRSPVLIINLWLQCLTTNTKWFSDVNAVYIIDLILRIAYQFQDAWYSVKDFFKFMYMKSDDTNLTKQSSFLTFLISSPVGPFPVPTPNALWLALLTLEVEHDVLEVQNNLWPELMRQLQLTTEKFSIDAIIKKSASIVGCSSCPSSSLSIYKLANLIITCSYSHPLLPIICQKFFYLYHSRVPMNSDEQQITDQFGVAQKFYEQNIRLMKKLKKFLTDTENYYHEVALKSDDDAMSQFYMVVSKLFKSYCLWLEETRLSQVNRISEFEFPPQFNPHKLAAIFARNETYWNDYVHFPSIRKEQNNAANAWLKFCFRYTPEKIMRSSSKVIESMDPKGIIIRHLESYDKPKPPPNVSHSLTKMVESITYSDLSNKRVIPKLIKAFKTVTEYSREFNMTIQEMNSLNCSFKEMIRLLYENKPMRTNRTVRCNSSNGCRGSGTVSVKIYNTSVNESIRTKILNNQDRNAKLADDQLSKMPHDFTRSAVQLRYSIRHLLEMYEASKYTKQYQQVNDIKITGLALFYEIVKGINEFVNLCQPSHELCAFALSHLGILIIEDQNREGLPLLKTALNRPDLINMISDLIVPSMTEPQYFLEMYKFIVDSYMRKCDTKILFVLLSKFDICNWLIHFKPKLCDITELLKLIVKGLECWNQSDSKLLQGALRRHLIHVFQYDFPEHYGEVLQIVLMGSSEQKLMPAILLDLLNALYSLSNCKLLDTKTASISREDIHLFATTQKIFSYKDLLDTMVLLSRHFVNERLQHGLHGLYPKHKEYCDNISLVLKTMGYSVIIAAVHAQPGVLGDKIVDDWLWPYISSTFSPWLVPYYPQNMENSPANWIKQVLSNNQILLPWSELYVDFAQKMVHTFVDCVLLILDTLPASDIILGHVFQWYEIHFGNPTVPKYILSSIHSSLASLPWNRFKPTPVHINSLFKIVQQFVPECHSFVGHITLRITWTPWLQFHIHQWDPNTRQRVLSSLLLCFVKLSYEPNVRENMQLVTLLHESIQYPWNLVDFQGCESVFEWFISSSEPSTILKLSSEHSLVDAEVLQLLQSAGEMVPLKDTSTFQHYSQLKRVLYVKTIVRMLRVCGSKYQQLLSTKEGMMAYHSAVVELLNLVENVCQGHNCSETDTIGLVMEIVCALQSPGEFTSKIFVEAIIIWQSNSQIGSKVLSCMLNAIGTCKMFTNQIFTLLEATLFNFFRTLDSARNFHKPTWNNVMTRLGCNLPQTIVGKELIQKELFLSLHVYSLYKLNVLKDFGDKITFLQTMHRHLESYKIIEQTEAKVAMIWGLIVTCGYQLLNVNDNSKSQLLTLGRYLQTTSNQSDGWGEGLLGAIGLKRDGVSKKRRILTKCLSCVIFSLFPDNRENGQLPCKEFIVAMEELIATVNLKKFSDIRSDGLVAVDIIDNQSKELGKTKENVCLLVRLFYKEHYLNSIEDVWNFI